MEFWPFMKKMMLLCSRYLDLAKHVPHTEDSYVHEVGQTTRIERVTVVGIDQSSDQKWIEPVLQLSWPQTTFDRPHHVLDEAANQGVNSLVENPQLIVDGRLIVQLRTAVSPSLQ